MKLIKDLIEELKNMDPERAIICQVVAGDGKAWNMNFEIREIPAAQSDWMAILTVSNPELEILPDPEHCKKPKTSSG